MNRTEAALGARSSLLDAEVRRLMDRPPELFVPGVSKVPLQVPSYGPDEVLEALESLVSGWVTMGRKVRAFEDAWAKYLGVKHAVMTNSGSSANLLALTALALPRGGEIITPSLTWATTVFPINQVGCTPVFVDTGAESYVVDPEAVERAVTEKTVAIMPVHLLGHVCDMGRLKEIASRHHVLLLEDACEAHGAEYGGRKVGSIGTVGTFSFFFSHHISTIEGGMVTTDDDNVADCIRALRAFGWIRDRSDRGRYTSTGLDPRFTFADAGYNMRPTEISGAFGIHQMGKLEPYIEARRRNTAFWNERLAPFEHWLLLPHEEDGTREVSFCYPVAVRENAPFSRKDLQDWLERNGVETRPIMAGYMPWQPAMRNLEHRVSGRNPNARSTHLNAFFWGNHHAITEEQREAVASYVEKFMRQFSRA